ncbi:unnamed protein product [Phytophthora fragariaefolia]|uniref:Unnamed protein product n=1 Tax=Phytophthora fragariaefolia TaxID=1490495 RepID=A0A9W6YC47_9STRA|nr:unnamed protein product [Phytophthora fragariaefolia]
MLKRRLSQINSQDNATARAPFAQAPRPSPLMSPFTPSKFASFASLGSKHLPAASFTAQLQLAQTLAHGPASSVLELPSTPQRLRMPQSQKGGESDSFEESLNGATPTDSQGDMVAKPPLSIDYNRDTATRTELDGKLLNERSDFWLDVRAAFVDTYPDGDERYLLMFDDDAYFVGIDPALTKNVHSAKNPHKMWKEASNNYFEAHRKFSSSGQNENEFRNFVDGRGDGLYLRKWLQTERINYLKGGLLSSDELDRMDPTTLVRDVPKNTTNLTPSKRKSHGALGLMAQSFSEYVSDRRQDAQRKSTSSQLQLLFAIHSTCEAPYALPLQFFRTQRVILCVLINAKIVQAHARVDNMSLVSMTNSKRSFENAPLID